LTVLDTQGQTAEQLSDLDAVVLATGFRNLGTGAQDERFPIILQDPAESLGCDAQGLIRIGRDYRLSARKGCSLPTLYLNGLYESSHGYGYGDAGALSLLSLRARDIFSSLSEQLGLEERVEKIA